MRKNLTNKFLFFSKNRDQAKTFRLKYTNKNWKKEENRAKLDLNGILTFEFSETMSNLEE